MITQIAGDQHPFRLAISTLSDRGHRANNEDYLGMADVAGRAVCCALADGAGGHGNGARAARLTVGTVLQGFRDNPLFAPAGLASLISMAEHCVSEEQPRSVSRHHMSATIVMLAIELSSGRALWAHWGDSRLYWFRDGKVNRMTEDHSLVQQLLQAGVYRNEDPRKLPNRSVLSGAVGAGSQVPPTVLPQAIDMAEGDAFLLCTDGLWENLLEAEMEAVLAEADGPDTWLERMAEQVRGKGKQNLDNFSALAVWVADNAELA